MSASPAISVRIAEPRRPRAEADVIVRAIDRSYRRRVREFTKTGQRWCGDDLIPDVLDDLERRGFDTGLHAIQAVLVELVRLHMLLEDKAIEIAQSRLPGNVIPMRAV